MTESSKSIKYVPGIYGKERPDVAELVENYMYQWEQRPVRAVAKKPQPMSEPTVCFSHKIGIGALETADILAKQIGYQVVDREILDYIVNKPKLHQKTVAFFDERYPGIIGNLLSMAFDKKGFRDNDYTRALFGAVFAIGGLKPTIFIGRGAHLLLPRDRVLAVRFICSRAYRINRLAGILNVSEKAAETKLAQIDREQSDFFESVYGKKDAIPYEFDMVINCDYLTEPQWAAEVVALAFKQKFLSLLYQRLTSEIL